MPVYRISECIIGLLIPVRHEEVDKQTQTLNVFVVLWIVEMKRWQLLHVRIKHRLQIP